MFFLQVSVTVWLVYDTDRHVVKWSICLTNISGRSNGSAGTRAPGPNCFVFMMFMRKTAQNIRLAPLLGELAPPPLENPGSVTDDASFHSFSNHFTSQMVNHLPVKYDAVTLMFKCWLLIDHLIIIKTQNLEPYSMCQLTLDE